MCTWDATRLLIPRTTNPDTKAKFQQVMSKPAKRDPEDIKREEKVYFFLLKLAGIKISPDNPNIENLKTLDITRKWGYTGDDAGRKFTERVLNGLNENKEENVPPLTLSRLVEILEGIEKYIEDSNKAENEGDSLPKVLSKLDKIKAIRKYCELSRQQKKDLGLPVDFQAYIEENLIDLSDDYTISSDQVSDCLEDKYIEIDKIKETKDQDSVLWTIKREYLNNLVKEVIENKFSKDWLNKNNEVVEKIQKKVENEITLIAVQSGLEIARYHLPKLLSRQDLSQFDEAYKKQWNYQLPDQWIKQLTSTVIDNKIISDQIPIAFRYLEVKKVGPLPFESVDDHLINEQLLKKDPDSTATKAAFEIFKKNNAYQVTIHFRLKIKKENKEENIDFVEEVSGISSILSLVRKALNRGLLWDISCLNIYFPVMQDVYTEDKYTEDKLFSGDGLASVWSKSRGRLIKSEDLKYLLENEEKNDFDSYVEGSDIIQSDYLGFDLIESIAISGFRTRLKLIEQTGIPPEEYIDHLKIRIKEKENLIQGKKYLRSYPFSLLVMEKHLNETILKDYTDKSKWSKIAYEAQLFIIEAYLDEGLVNQAGNLLKTLKSHEDNFSHFLKASYYLCQAEYTSLRDKNKSEGRKGPKQELIDECNDYIEKAEDQLRKRLLEFFRIGEIAQGNLSPLYYYWTKIYIIKARLSLFFPVFLGESVNQLFPSLVSFGKARVYYAPREGDSYLCAQVSLYQSWCYLIQAYIGNEPEGFEKDTCIKWAKKLINNGLFNYQEASQECYRDYTDNLFSDQKYEKDNLLYEQYELLEIECPPFLNYSPSGGVKEDNRGNKSKDGTIKIYDIGSELIKANFVDEEQTSKKPIDLFGQHSSLYFFALGMLKLCDNYNNEEDAKENLKQSFNYFVCSWAIAQGGSQLSKTSDPVKMNRNFDELKINDVKIEDNFNVSKLRGIFFHCVSEWMDLAKIFMAVCKSILGEDEDFQVVEAILTEGGEDVFSKVPEHFDQVVDVAGQKDYNEHLKLAFKNIKDYLSYYISEKHKNKSFIERRDEVVRAIFIRLRGGL